MIKMTLRYAVVDFVAIYSLCCEVSPTLKTVRQCQTWCSGDRPSPPRIRWQSCSDDSHVDRNWREGVVSLYPLPPPSPLLPCPTAGRDAVITIMFIIIMETMYCVCLSFCHRLVGLVVKASSSRAEGPGFESRLRRDFFGVKSYQWLKNWHSNGYPARRLAL